MSEITLVLGGTRSGKSEIAERLATGREVIYVATCRPGDDELVARVHAHRARRPSSWTTIESPTDPVAALASSPRTATGGLLECLSLLVFNWMEEGVADAQITDRISRLLEVLRATPYPWIVVSNDVSGSLVPPDPTSRRYQELLGRANQQVAAVADRVLLAVAGISMIVK